MKVAKLMITCNVILIFNICTILKLFTKECSSILYTTKVVLFKLTNLKLWYNIFLNCVYTAQETWKESMNITFISISHSHLNSIDSQYCRNANVCSFKTKYLSINKRQNFNLKNYFEF